MQLHIPNKPTYQVATGRPEIDIRILQNINIDLRLKVLQALSSDYNHIAVEIVVYDKPLEQNYKKDCLVVQAYRLDKIYIHYIQPKTNVQKRITESKR